MKISLSVAFAFTLLVAATNGQYGYDEGFDYGYYPYDFDYSYFDGLDELFATHDPDCEDIGSGKVKMNGTQACDIRISGGDAMLPNLKGGIDGVYVLDRCFDGRPAYVRKDSSSQDDRILFYDGFYQDWGLKWNNGISPANDEELIAFGGFGVGEERPQIVSPGYWMFNDTLTTLKSKEIDFPWVDADSLKVECNNERGVNVNFEGKVQTPQHTPRPEPHVLPSQSSAENDGFYTNHATITVDPAATSSVSSPPAAPQEHQQQAPSHHSYGILKAFYVMLIIAAVAGVAFMGRKLVKKNLPDIGRGGRSMADIDLGAPRGNDHSYLAPRLEHVSLLGGHGADRAV